MAYNISGRALKELRNTIGSPINRKPSLEGFINSSRKC